MKEEEGFALVVPLPVRIVSVANLREHWRKCSARTSLHRTTASTLMSNYGRHSNVVMPVVVTLTRVAPRQMDGDNLQSGFKAVRDGIADWLAVDDADPRVTWRYAQRSGKPKEYAVEVVVEWDA